jgi:hypothetical protein
MAFITNASERMRIDSSGNVGIGTSSPSAKLDVRSGNIGITLGNEIRLTDASYTYPTILKSNYIYGTGDVTTLSSAGNNGSILNFQTVGTERARIDSSGNFGIGTSSPGAKLEVSGGQVRSTSSSIPSVALNSTASGSWKSSYQFLNNGSAKWEFGVDIGSVGNNNLFFYDDVAGAERMHIDSSGIVTKPYQPGFVAVKTLNDNYALSTTNGGAISFWATKSLGNHISSGYNTSTYTFTAPTAGLYFFTFCLVAYTTGGPGDLGFFVNGGLYLGDGMTINDFSGSGWHSLSISHAIYLNSGDTCVAARAYIGSNPANTNWRGFFSGFLIG